MHNKETYIYLVEKLWYDALENRNSYGYEVVGYVYNVADVDLKAMVSEKSHWAFLKDMNLFKIQKIELYFE